MPPVKRMPGEGSILKLTKTHPDGTTFLRYRAQLSLGPRNGRRYLTRTCRTRREARDALAELKLAATGSVPSRQPLGSYLRTWLNETARPAISPNTYRGYRAVLGHLEPLADIPLGELTADDIEAVLNRMTARRRHQTAAKPAAPKTIRNVQIMLRAALARAQERGHIPTNPAKLVPLRRVPRANPTALTPDAAKAILAAVSGDRFEAAYALALMGLRSGEVLGLAWDDYSASEAAIHVRRQIVPATRSRPARRAQLKSRASARIVPLPPFVVAKLEAHRQAQLLERIAAGKPTEDGLVFVTPAGVAVNGSWLTAHFGRLLEAAGLPRMPLHALRHGFASLLAATGVHPSVAQALLGHASVTTTLNVYTHSNAAQQREAVERLEEVVG